MLRKSTRKIKNIAKGKDDDTKQLLSDLADRLKKIN
jgi:hypothetical protein